MPTDAMDANKLIKVADNGMPYEVSMPNSEMDKLEGEDLTDYEETQDA